jgi:hypothetical protein
VLISYNCTTGAPPGARGLRSVLLAVSLAGAVLPAIGAPAAAQVPVLTHHYDVSRSGWNEHETALTPKTVGGDSGFGLQATVPLDSLAEAQPLVVPGVVIAGDPNAGKHDVVYVATDGNTIYAIDPTQGTVLLSRNLGPVAPRPSGCGAGGIGIGSTPVIDPLRRTMYLISYTAVAQPVGPPASNYYLHALDLATLEDKLPPVIVAGTRTLTDGSTLAFVPAQQRQRPALLEHANNIYAAFGSICDNGLARGWVFGWSAATLVPVNADAGGVAIPALTNSDATAPHGTFLSSIWMSGAGLAADKTGIYYVTGNSDKSATTYNPLTNTENSVVRLSADTTTVLDLFTPANLPLLDPQDFDFGSGGVVLLPGAAKGPPHLAAAAGKKGVLFLMDRGNLGGYTPGGPDKVLAEVSIGKCWCEPSYFDDGTPTLVSSGGNTLHLWTVQAGPNTTLVSRAPATTLSTGDDPGFFTTVSSNGASGTIVWAVTRPLGSGDTRVWLYAYAVGAPGTRLRQIFAVPAGTWTDPNHNSNIVPVVANGRVYVASHASLAIFGLGAGAEPGP